MRQTICLLVFSLAFVVAASAQESKPNGYAGQEQRAIKSLSAEEVEQLLQGQGMGLAKAAELNHYPGPRHVLELAAQLELTQEQRANAQTAFDRMHAEAVKLGQQIVARERELDAAFAGGEIDARKLEAATAEIARLQGLLRAAHLAAHLETRRILSPQQIKKYDELRGYNSNAPGHSEHEHMHKH